MSENRGGFFDSHCVYVSNHLDQHVNNTAVKRISSQPRFNTRRVYISLTCKTLTGTHSDFLKTLDYLYIATQSVCCILYTTRY